MNSVKRIKANRLGKCGLSVFSTTCSRSSPGLRLCSIGTGVLKEDRSWTVVPWITAEIADNETITTPGHSQAHLV